LRDRKPACNVQVMTTSRSDEEADAIGRLHALSLALARRDGTAVGLCETHISWVLLGRRIALKVKKPVTLPFLDFGSAERRRAACEAELRLNRRLAPGLYRAVLPFSWHDGQPSLDGRGPALDWVLCMRRFEDGALLSERIARGRIDAPQLEALGVRLAAFQAAAPVAAQHSPWGTPQAVTSTVQGALQALRGIREDARIDGLAAWFDGQGGRLSRCLARRRREGHVREGHGDLHLGNLVMLDGRLVPFDCIEFDARLRWIDEAADIAFLTMDLAAHGRPDLRWRFLDAWLQARGDAQALRVLRYYEAYRAVVRALTKALSPHPCDAPDYLATAVDLAAAGPRPALLLTHGLSGSGKSTLAAALAQRTGALRWRSDIERKRLLGLAPLASTRGITPQAYGRDLTERTYGRLLGLAAATLAAGLPVVVDATFLQRTQRRRFQCLARRLQVPWAILHCHAPAPLLAARIQARSAQGVDASEADLAVLASQQAVAEPLDAHERALAIDVDASGAFDADALIERWVSLGGPASAAA
jgi:aminoglycoside phosphotransferase family enzyme/predicted kinase